MSDQTTSVDAVDECTAKELRDHVLGLPLAEQTLFIPEWNKSIRVREMTGFDRDSWEASLIGQNGQKNYGNLRARLIVRCVVTKAGERVWSDDDASVVGRLGAKGLDRVFAACQRINGLSGEEVEELRKN